MHTNELAELFEPSAAPAPPAPRPRWEYRWKAQAVVFVLLVAVAAPLLPGLVRASEDGGLRALDWLTATSLRRQVTGFSSLALIAFQLLHAARRRRRGASAQQAWSAAHKLIALALVPLVLLHTGGRAGAGANRLLLATLIGLVLVAQAGHVMKALVHDRVHAEGRCPTARMRKFEYQANADEGVVHSAGHLLHVALATAVTVLLLFHIFTVYYF